jgi:hypothetical protein
MSVLACRTFLAPVTCDVAELNSITTSFHISVNSFSPDLLTALSLLLVISEPAIDSPVSDIISFLPSLAF